MKKPYRLVSLLLVLAMLVSLFPSALAAGSYTGTIDPPVLTPKLNETRSVTVTFTADGVPVTADMLEEKNWSVRWSILDNRESEVSVVGNTDNPFGATVTALALPATTQDPKEVTVVADLLSGSTILYQAICRVTVQSNVEPGIELSETAIEVSPQDTRQLSATITPEGMEGVTLTWSSADTSIATVDPSTGLVTGVAPGETTVTVRSSTGLSASCSVTVRGIVISPSSVTVRQNGNATLTLNRYGSDLQRATVTWVSEDSSVARVEQGYVYGIYEGKTTVTATVLANNRTYSARCEVTVESSTATPITASVGASEPLAFSGLRSRLQSQCFSVLGASLSYVSGLSVPTDQGTLYYGYRSEGDTGLGIGTGERYYVSPGLSQNGLDDVYFVPKPDFSGTAEITYMGYTASNAFFQGTIQVTVAEAEDVSYNAAGKPVQFNVDDFNRVCRSRLGGNLSAVSFSQPDSSRGALYYQYISEESPGTLVEEDTRYRSGSTPSLGSVYFVPAAGSSGEVVIPYTAYDVNGNTYRGRVTIRVSASTGTGDVSYTVAQGGTVTFDDDDFNDLCRSLTGYALDYVQFTPPASSEGRLTYDGGSAVSASDSYYNNASPYLRRVRFAAADGFTGLVSIPFTGWDTRGNRFSGTVEIAVGSSGTGDIRYTAFAGGYVTFDGDDFGDLCRDLTDSTLSWIQFNDLPSGSQGDLVYNYDSSDGDFDNRVTESRRYYRSSTPRIDRITFIPDGGFTGTVTLSFEGRSTSGDSFSGSVVIGVEEGGGDIAYSAGYGQSVSFDASDFDDLCRAYTGDGLRSVRFTLPSASDGTLYYDGNTQVSASRDYGYASAPYLDRVEFRPASGFAGTVEISYTGRSTGGETFRGVVAIAVEEPAGATPITYSTTHAPVTFSAQDFVRACEARGLGSLQSVRFSAPNSSAGRLYYQYDGLIGSSEVRSATSYSPLQSPNIGDVTFVPKAGYRGTATVTYSATDSRGNEYQGQVRISVQPNTTSSYFNDLGNYGWAVSSIDLLYENGVVTGTGGGGFRPAQSISRGDFMLMLCRALNLSADGQLFSDVPADSYYAEAIRTARALGIADGYPDGGFHPGAPVTRQDAMVFLQRALQAAGWSLGGGSSSTLSAFPDGGSVASYAQSAVAVMVEYGVLTGIPAGTLNPYGALSRAEMAVVLARVMTL